VRCHWLRYVIGLAYGTFAGDNLRSRRLEVVGGPKWLDSDWYDISAKAEGGASAARMAQMLQALLEDRFQLKVHVASEAGPVYALTVIKNNPNLRPTKPGSCIPVDPTNLPPTIKPGGPKYCGILGGGGRDGANTTLDWYGMTMAEFAGRGLTMVDRPVIDKTGLTGQYDIHLEFALVDPYAAVRPGAAGRLEPPPPDDSGTSIFTALESQLGLKLSPTKGPVDVIVVDQAEKPSTN
jgi:uncharacterized protein (TIGR03435 family)